MKLPSRMLLDTTVLIRALGQRPEDPRAGACVALYREMERAGCEVLMPWGAPIGSGQGLNNRYGLRTLRAYAPGIPLVVDAGLGAPSHAAAAMELGYDACLLNTAVAKALDPVRMARAFGAAISAGRDAYRAGLMQPRDMAQPSTPVAGTPFFEIGLK